MGMGCSMYFGAMRFSLRRIISLADLLLARLFAGIVFVFCVGAGTAFAQDQEANDDALSARSKVAAIAFVTKSDLPRAPISAKTQKDCNWMVVRPKTSGGRLAASLGWGVLSEVPLGSYQVVSFGGQFEPLGSGVCHIGQGHIGIFFGSRLLALAYVTSGGRQSIGVATPLQNGVRIWSGDKLGAPVADLSFIDGYLFQLGPVASKDSVCAGAGVVPNIYGNPINLARKILMANGWAPVKNPRDLASDRVQFARELALSRRGVVEVDSCSGTGLAYCRYYLRRGNMELALTTAGQDDFPMVVGYSVACDRAHWHKDA